MIEQIELYDQWLFQYLNGLHHPFLDELMWHISGKWQWILWYLLLLNLLIKKYEKNSWWLLGGVVLLIVLSDQFSVKLFKEVVERYRPCHNLELKDTVHLVNNRCGGKFGFVSSHAANTFALATYLGLLLRKPWFIILLIWASLVSYSRVYLGVHYPLDILGGAILGGSLGFVVYQLVKKFIFNKA